METKKKYIIWISGEDYTFFFREFTDAEAELVKSVVSELETGREGCAMDVYPSDEELDKMTAEVMKDKSWEKAYRQNFMDIVHTKFPDKSINWQESVAVDIQNRVLKKKK